MLVSNHEEAEAKMVLQTLYPFAKTSEGNVVTRSHSVFLLPGINANGDRVFVYSNKDEDRKNFGLFNVNMGQGERLAVLGFQALTGNDFVSAFFRNGKHLCWRVLVDNPKYLKVIKDLDTH